MFSRFLKKTVPLLVALMWFSEACGLESSCLDASQPLTSDFHTLILEEEGIEQLGGQEQGVRLVGVRLPGSKKKQVRFTEDLQSRFLNRELGMDDLEDLRCFVLTYYKEHGSHLVEVIIPPQDITEKVLHVVIAESRLGKITTSGNNWSSKRMTKKALGLKPGEKIQTDDLLVDLSYLNRNPFKRTDIIFSPGDEKGTTDIELVTKEKKAYRVYAGVDNRGNEAIGTYRQYEGFNCGDFLGLDHIFSYQLTTSLPVKRMYAHAAYYEIPLPKTMALSLYGGFSRVRSKRFSEDFRNSGENVQFSTRYHLPLMAWMKGSNDIALGFDYKRSNNTVLFSEDPIIARMATLSQLAFTYRYDQLFPSGWGTFDLELYISPIRFLSNQNKADYQLLSPKAIPQYYYWILGWEKSFNLPKCMSLYLRLKGQYANQNLLPSEQLGLGGYDTVRGYREREINGDQGILANLEFRSPYLSLFKLKSLCETNTQCQCNNQPKDALMLLAFIDYGFTKNHHKVDGEKNAQYIVSMGPGLNYLISPYLNLTLYWGYRFRATDVSGTGGRVNFNLVASF